MSYFQRKINFKHFKYLKLFWKRVRTYLLTSDSVSSTYTTCRPLTKLLRISFMILMRSMINFFFLKIFDHFCFTLINAYFYQTKNDDHSILVPSLKLWFYIWTHNFHRKVIRFKIMFVFLQSVLRIMTKFVPNLSSSALKYLGL